MSKKKLDLEDVESLLSAALDDPKPVEETKTEPSAVVSTKEKSEPLKKALPLATNVFYDSALKTYCRVVIEYDLSNNTTREMHKEILSDNMALALKKNYNEQALKLLRKEDDV